MTSATDDEWAIALGQPWPGDPLPPGASLSWYQPHLLVIGYDDGSGRVDDRLVRELNQPVTLGLAQYRTTPVLIVKVAQFGLIENMLAWHPGQPAPEVPVSDHDSEHILWTLVGVQHGTVHNLKAFTTSPRFTLVLRRLLAEQRAAGPVTVAQFRANLADWQASASTPKQAWARCLVTSREGA